MGNSNVVLSIGSGFSVLLSLVMSYVGECLNQRGKNG